MSVKTIQLVVNESDLRLHPELEQAGIGAGVSVNVSIASDTPEFTIRADSQFGLQSMMAVTFLAHQLPKSEKDFLLAKMREFEIWLAADIAVSRTPSLHP